MIKNIKQVIIENEVDMNNLTFDWNLDDIYKNEQDAKADFEKVKKEQQKLAGFKGKLKTRDAIYDFFTLSEKINLTMGRVECYLHLRKSLNGKDEFARTLEAEIVNFENEIMPKLAFASEELSKNKTEFLLSLKGDKAFRDFDNDIQDIIDGKKHILKENIASVLNMNPSFGAFGEVFDNFNDVDLDFGTIKVENKVEKLTHASYGKLITNKDQNLRKKVYNQVHEAYKKFNYTLGSLYLSDAKESMFFSKIRKFKTLLENSCFNDKTDPKVLSTLIEVVHNNLDLFYEVERLRKKAMGVGTYYYFDNYYPLGKVEGEFDYQSSVDIVLDALKVMGEDYTSVLKKAFSSGWLDVYEKPAKTSGGFCLDIFGVHPYVLLNHSNTYSGLSTIAHEMGHAMHGYYTSKTQPITKSNPSIFVCEVASIVNEIILNNYMINKAKTKEEKLFFIDQLLHNFYTTLYRQTMFAEFEHYVYTSLQENKPIIVESLNEEYEKLQALYFGDGAKATEFSKFEWSRIPHFYRPYYVYKYSTGFISACTIANNILKGDKKYIEKYMNFLKAGSSVKPLDLLKSVDVDLTKKQTLEGAFELYKSLIEQFKALI